jgi:SAM-dependent methyltransferase
MIYFLLGFRRFRTYISFIRCFWYIKVKKKLILDENNKSVSKNTIFSNLRRIIINKEKPHPKAQYLFGIDKAHDGSKVRLLLDPLMSIDKISSQISNLKVLVIGPKLEAEILSVMSYGIPRHNIEAIDLISYSPWIRSGDMHEMPFADNSFDIIISGWVIAYSDDKKKAAKEMIRVSKNGTVICIGVSHSPATNNEIVKERGYLIGSAERIDSTDFLFNLFKPSIENIYFKHDIDSERQDMFGKIITLFSIRK